VRLATAAMGTRFELVIEGDRAERHRGAAEAALDAVEACHTRFSRFIPDSLVAHLARIPPGTPVSLDRETFELFADAVAVWRGSGGAFDITGDSGAMNAIRLDPRRLTLALDRQSLLLDLGAIAKGHAVECAARILRDAGVESAFVHGGTSSAAAIGPRIWRVSLQEGEVVGLQEAALGVSRTGHETPHPTLDPATRRPLEVERYVAVTGPSARLCDAWATAAAVLGGRPPELPVSYEVRLPLTAHRSPLTTCPAAAAS
jgi:thiamine biosynthesis lipoprotein